CASPRRCSATGRLRSAHRACLAARWRGRRRRRCAECAACLAKEMPMPKLDLVSHHLCPYVQRAVITLTEKGAPFTRTYVDLANKPDWFTAISPLGKVPLLRIDDDDVLFESAVICEYLEETIAPALHPRD